MSELRGALGDIADIKERMAATALFRGFGPAVMAGTGGLALVAASVQGMNPDLLASSPVVFVLYWTGVATLSSVAIAVEAFARCRRHHGGLADAHLFNAAEHFFPAGAIGALLAVVFLIAAPDAAWVLPGLWSLLIALALFAAYRFLPRTIAIAAGWYVVAGAGALLAGADSRTLEPAAMGIVFGIGQLILAGVLKFAFASDRRPPVGGLR